MAYSLLSTNPPGPLSLPLFTTRWLMSAKSLSFSRLRAARGFTLIELLITVAMIGILTAITLPRIVELSRRVQLDGAAQQLLGDLERSRTEAIKKNQPITLKKTSASNYTITGIGDRTLSGATFSSGADSIRFAPFGPPTTGAATFVLTANGRTKTIAVNGAGHAKVQ
jgi:type IV fimbrial biogenesis protein FimT